MKLTLIHAMKLLKWRPSDGKAYCVITYIYTSKKGKSTELPLG